MREELSNLYFDDGGSGTGVWWWEEVWRRTLLLLLLCDASLRNFSYLFASDGEEWNFPSLLCVAQEILCELFYDSFARFKWQSKLWFTISIEDYTKWTIKAWGHNTTTAKLFRSSTRRFRCMRNFCDNLKRKKILFSATFFLSLSFVGCLRNNHLFKAWKSFFCCWGERSNGFSSVFGNMATEYFMYEKSASLSYLFKISPIQKDVAHMPAYIFCRRKFVFMENWASESKSFTLILISPLRPRRFCVHDQLISNANVDLCWDEIPWHCDVAFIRFWTIQYKLFREITQEQEVIRNGNFCFSFFSEYKLDLKIFLSARGKKRCRKEGAQRTSWRTNNEERLLGLR